MLWLLQIPAPVLGFLWVGTVVALSVGGLILFRKAVSHTRLENANAVSGTVFQLGGVLYAVLVAFVVVVVWEQFGDAEDATSDEATAITDLLRDSAALPAEAREDIQDKLLAYTRQVVEVEFPRMRRGEAVEEQSDQLTAVWDSYLQVQPETRNEIAFFDHAIVRLNDLTADRKMRVSTGEAQVPGELWVLLLGGGGVVMAFTFLLGTRDLVVHSIAVGLTAALLGFVLYLIFALEHPYVGALSVSPAPYTTVLQDWN
jgi:protein-S-isoprenylcysteine O-methyltransferase Ste14